MNYARSVDRVLTYHISAFLATIGTSVQFKCFKYVLRFRGSGHTRHGNHEVYVGQLSKIPKPLYDQLLFATYIEANIGADALYPATEFHRHSLRSILFVLYPMHTFQQVITRRVFKPE